MLTEFYVKSYKKIVEIVCWILMIACIIIGFLFFGYLFMDYGNFNFGMACLGAIVGFLFVFILQLFVVAPRIVLFEINEKLLSTNKKENNNDSTDENSVSNGVEEKIQENSKITLIDNTYKKINVVVFERLLETASYSQEDKIFKMNYHKEGDFYLLNNGIESSVLTYIKNYLDKNLIYVTNKNENL